MARRDLNLSVVVVRYRPLKVGTLASRAGLTEDRAVQDDYFLPKNGERRQQLR